MKVRRCRVNSQGKTNFDFKASQDIEYQKDSRLQLLASSVKNSLQEMTLQKHQKVAPNPLEFTQQFYKTNNKVYKKQHCVSDEREFQLEDVKKRQKVFNGDTDYVSYEHKDIKWNQKKEQTNLPFIKQQNDDEDKIVSIDKVKQLIKLLRSRYSHQYDAYKIFKKCDIKNQGQLNLDQFQEMMNGLGIQCNKQEVDLLMSTVDVNQNGQMSLDEFQLLIYQDDKYFQNTKEKLSITEKNQLKQNMIDKIITSEDLRKLSGFKLQIKRNLKKIQNYFNKKKISLNSVNKQQLQECFENIKLNENQQNTKQINQFLQNYTKDDGKIDLIDLNEELSYFCFNVDHDKEQYQNNQIFSQDGNNIQIQAMKEKLKIYNDYQQNNKVEYENYAKILDQKATEYFKTKQKVVRSLKKIVKNTQDFDQELKEIYGENFENKSIPKQEFIDNMKQILNKNKQNLDKKVFDEFINTFQCAKDGSISLMNISNQIYNENISQYQDRIYRQKKVLRNIVQIENIDKNELQKIQSIFQKVDDKVFFGTKKIFEVFNQFDSDKDGFISKKEFEYQLKDKYILDNEESQIFLNSIFKNDSEFLNFNQFAKLIRPNMGQDLVNKENYQNVGPCNDNNNNLLKQTKNLVNQENEFISTFQSKIDLIPYQRYSFTPEYQNTFGNYQGQLKSSLYNNTERQFKKGYDKNDFQLEDKLKKQQIQETICRKKQGNIKNLEKFELDNIRIDRDQSNLRTKSLATWTYQQQFKRKNDTYQNQF